MPVPKPKAVSDEDMRSLLGEGFHTAFRKAIDGPDAMPIHRMISKMDPQDWSAVISWVVWGLKESGVRFHWKA